MKVKTERINRAACIKEKQSEKGKNSQSKRKLVRYDFMSDIIYRDDKENRKCDSVIRKDKAKSNRVRE